MTYWKINTEYIDKINHELTSKSLFKLQFCEKEMFFGIIYLLTQDMSTNLPKTHSPKKCFCNTFGTKMFLPSLIILHVFTFITLNLKITIIVWTATVTLRDELQMTSHAYSRVWLLCLRRGVHFVSLRMYIIDFRIIPLTLNWMIYIILKYLPFGPSKLNAMFVICFFYGTFSFKGVYFKSVYKRCSLSETNIIYIC